MASTFAKTLIFEACQTAIVAAVRKLRILAQLMLSRFKRALAHQTRAADYLVEADVESKTPAANIAGPKETLRYEFRSILQHPVQLQSLLHSML